MATEQQRLELIVQARNRTKVALGQMNSSLNQIGGSVGQLSSLLLSPLGLVAGMTFLGIKTVSTAMELAELSAQADRTYNTFERLVGGADVAGVALEELRRATKGGVNDQILMAASSKFLTMHLAENIKEAEHMARVATQLGMAMNMPGGPTAAMNSFALMLANQSILRLDEFGISSGRVRQHIKDLQTAMPGLSRETAFMQAAMAEAALAMQRVGEQAPTAWEAQKVAVENLKVEIGLYLEALEGVPNVLATVYSSITQMIHTEREAIAVDHEYRGTLDDILEATGLNVLEQRSLRRAYNDTIGRMKWGMLTIEDGTARLHELLGVSRSWRDELARIDPELRAGTQLHKDLAVAIHEVASAWRSVEAPAEDALRKFTAIRFQYALALRAEDIPAQIRLYEDQMRQYTEIDAEYWTYKTKIAGLEKRLQDTTLQDIRAHNRELERLQDEHLAEMHSAVESALTATTVTEEDILATKLGMYREKWDEAARQLDDVAKTGVLGEGWKKYFDIPAEALAGGPEAVKLWAKRIAGETRALLHPELIDWEAFGVAYKRILWEREQRKRTLEIAYERVGGGADKAAVARALGIPEGEYLETGKAIGEASATGIVQVEYGAVLIRTIATQIDDRKEEITSIGVAIGTHMLSGLEGSITPGAVDRLIDLFGPSFVNWLMKKGYLGEAR